MSQDYTVLMKDFFDVMQKINNCSFPQQIHENHQLFYAIELSHPYTKEIDKHPRNVILGPVLDCCSINSELDDQLPISNEELSVNWVVRNTSTRRSCLLTDAIGDIQCAIKRATPYFSIPQLDSQDIVLVVQEPYEDDDINLDPCHAIPDGPSMVLMHLHTEHNTITFPVITLGILVFNAAPTRWEVFMDIRKNLLAVRRDNVPSSTPGDIQGRIWKHHWDNEDYHYEHWPAHFLEEYDIGSIPMFESHDCGAVLLEGTAEGLVALDDPFGHIVYPPTPPKYPADKWE
jgi:hypothetical protein